MELICSSCNRIIDSDNINVTTDLAKCGYCGAIHKVSSLVSATEGKTLATPPKGSKIELTKEPGDTTKLFLPRQGITASHIPQLFFVIFGLCFISFWTRGASQGSIFFALFSIPFWFVCLTMLGGIINSIYETQALTISKGQIILKKTKPINSKRYEFNFSDIQSIKMTHMKAGPFSFFSNPRHLWRLQWSFGAGLTIPAIISGSGTQYFFEEANDAEQEWVTSYLTNKLQQVKR